MTRAQLTKFLATAQVRERRWYPLFLTYARTGARLGEGVALQVGLHDDGDLDFTNRKIHFARALSDNGRRIDTPKTGGRKVDMSQQLADTLHAVVIARRATALRRGATDGRLWLLRDFTEWCYWTGMRKGEAAALQWKHFDRETWTIRLHARSAKTRRGRAIVLRGAFREIIERRLAARRLDCAFIFHRDGDPIAEFRRAWARHAVQRASRAGASTTYAGRRFGISCAVASHGTSQWRFRDTARRPCSAATTSRPRTTWVPPPSASRATWQRSPTKRKFRPFRSTSTIL